MSGNLNHYLQAWNLSRPQLLAQTLSSYVYKVLYGGETVVLKLLTPIGEEERTGALALRCYNGRGAVRLLRADDHAQLVEYADGETLVPMVKRGDDERAAEIIADVLNQLHQTRYAASPEGLIPLRVYFESLFKSAARDEQNGVESIYRRAAPIADRFLSDQRDLVVLHGDMHHDNVAHSERGWLAFDPKGVYGDRAYDTANTLCNPIDMDELVLNEARLLKIARILAQNLGIELSRVLSFAYLYACLSASWSYEDGQDDTLALGVAEITEPYVRLP